VFAPAVRAGEPHRALGSGAAACQGVRAGVWRPAPRWPRSRRARALRARAAMTHPWVGAHQGGGGGMTLIEAAPASPGTKGRRTPRVAIVGAGMSGICAAAKLAAAGVHDVVVYEKADRVGGTWRE